VIGGSDSHTLRSVGKTYTEVSGANGIGDFLAGMRRGQCVPHGESGDYWKLTSAVLGIGASLVRTNPAMALAGGLFACAPIVTFGNYIREVAFAWYWGQKNRPVEPAGAPAGAASEAGL
jgi:hypothetical protein